MRDLRLWAILLIAMTLRGLLFAAAVGPAGRPTTPDSFDYAILGQQIGLGGEYRNVEGVLIKPAIFRTPGYPLVLAASHHLPGPYTRLHPTVGVRVAPVLAFQVLVDLHLVLLAYGLGRCVRDHATGLLAALLLAVCPVSVAASCRVLSDSLFAFLLTAAAVLALLHMRSGRWRTLIPAAVAMGVACYVRPVGLAMSGLFAFALLLRPKRLRRAGAFAGIVAACVAPWVYRNAVVADYVGFSSFAGQSLYMHSAAEVMARQRGIALEDARERLYAEEGWPHFDPDLIGQPGLSNAVCYGTSGDIARYRARRAREILVAHPWLYAKIHLAGSLAFWLPGGNDVLEIAGFAAGQKGTLAVLHSEGLVAAVRHYVGDETWMILPLGAMALLTLAVYVGLAACVVVFVLRRVTRRSGGDAPPLSAAPAAFVALGVLLVLASWLLPGPAAHPRFRVPVAPLLCVAAAAGYASTFRRGGSRDPSGVSAAEGNEQE